MSAGLRHQPPALVIGPAPQIDAEGGRCDTLPGEWSWARLVDGAAQLAGLVASSRLGRPVRDGRVVELRDLEVERRQAASATIDVRFEARVVDFFRFGFAVRGAADEPICHGRLTLALTVVD